MAISSRFWKFSLLVCYLAVCERAIASDGGWILWQKRMFFSLDQPDKQYEDAWTVQDGYDTAVDCHAAAKIKDGLDEITNKYTVNIKPVASAVSNRCFPVAFDPRSK